MHAGAGYIGPKRVPNKRLARSIAGKRGAIKAIASGRYKKLPELALEVSKVGQERYWILAALVTYV